MTSTQPVSSNVPDLYDATIEQLLQGLDGFHFTVVQLVSVGMPGMSPPLTPAHDLNRHTSVASKRSIL